MVSKKQTILLIEDDEAIRQMYQLKFEGAGVTLYTADDGKQGLKLALKLQPDILLLDLRIPTMGGEEILEKLRKHKWAKQMKVIILTNINEKEAPKELKELHYDRYIVKAHVTPSKVLKAVKEVMLQ